MSDQRPGSPLENLLQDIAFNAVFRHGKVRDGCKFSGPETNCPECGKTVKAIGLRQHIRDKHESLEK